MSLISLRKNDKDLIYLDAKVINAVFDCVYDGWDGLSETTNDLLMNEEFKALIHIIKTMQEYNYRYRFNQYSNLFPIFDETCGPFQTNSEGTSLWLAMGLAIKDIYGLRRETLKNIMKQVIIRK